MRHNRKRPRQSRAQTLHFPRAPQPKLPAPHQPPGKRLRAPIATNLPARRVCTLSPVSRNETPRANHRAPFAPPPSNPRANHTATPAHAPPITSHHPHHENAPQTPAPKTPAPTINRPRAYTSHQENDYANRPRANHTAKHTRTIAPENATFNHSNNSHKHVPTRHAPNAQKTRPPHQTENAPVPAPGKAPANHAPGKRAQ